MVGGGRGVLVGGGMAVFVGTGMGLGLGLGVGELHPKRVSPRAANATSTTSLILRIVSSRARRKIRARPLRPLHIV